MFEMGESRARRGGRPGPRVPRRARRRRRPGSVVAPTLEGSAAAARRGPGAGRAGRLRSPRRTASRHRPQPPRAPGRRARPARRGRPRAATTSTPTSPAACRSPSPGSTCRSRSPSPRRSATGPIAPAPSRSARSACSASCAPVGGLERRLREAARLGFDRAVVPRAARPRRAARRARDRVVEVGIAARGDRRGASAERSDRDG